jgi:LmbE family N-acetylglucosaminyl deacetylase
MTTSTGAVLFQRRGESGTTIVGRGDRFADVFTDWKPGRESFLFFAPHDDDSAISLGMVIREARRQDIPVRVIVVTDGQNGYVSLRDKPTIVARRVEETYASYELLGVDRSEIVFLNFPDGGLQNYFGRQVAKPGDPTDDHGFTGLENHFVRELRRRVLIEGDPVAPTRVFVPSAADYHQDHVAVAREIPISIFHAIGGIWPECGEKIDRAPCLYWHCVYCKFADSHEPNIRVVGDAQALAVKIASVEAYNSQGQIAPMLDELRRSPPVEYLLEESFSLFQPGVYDHCFSK